LLGIKKRRRYLKLIQVSYSTTFNFKPDIPPFVIILEYQKQYNSSKAST